MDVVPARQAPGRYQGGEEARATRDRGRFMKLDRKRIVRATMFVTLGLVILFVAYLVLLCHPGPFFGYTFARGGITVFSDEPIPPESAGRILEEVERRLALSPLAAPPRSEDLHIYICNRGWRFVLFANYRCNVGGLTYSPLTDNVFLRGVHFDANRLIGPSGNEVPGERTLSYFVAHEVGHVLLGRELGIVKYWQLPSWKNEGYADLVAKGEDFDYERAREQLRNGDRELDPQRSGLYLRYHLLVAYLLERKGISVGDLLSREFDPARLEEEILSSDGRDPS
jgi:hypothetical protein